jgi:hypothetical protein
MLAIVGLLTEQQQQGVVALLGGVPLTGLGSNSNSNAGTDATAHTSAVASAGVADKSSTTTDSSSNAALGMVQGSSCSSINSTALTSNPSSGATITATITATNVIAALDGNSSSTTSAGVTTTTDTTNATGISQSSSSSSSSSMAASLLIEEPSSLAQQRQALGVSLEELAMVMLKLCAQDQPDYQEDRYVSILNNLVAAFDHRQLPSITRAQQSRRQSWSNGVPPRLQKAWHEGELRDTYLTWVQNTLLKIINGVLSEAGARV